MTPSPCFGITASSPPSPTAANMCGCAGSIRDGASLCLFRPVPAIDAPVSIRGRCCGGSCATTEGRCDGQTDQSRRKTIYSLESDRAGRMPEDTVWRLDIPVAMSVRLRRRENRGRRPFAQRGITELPVSSPRNDDDAWHVQYPHLPGLGSHETTLLKPK